MIYVRPHTPSNPFVLLYTGIELICFIMVKISLAFHLFLKNYLICSVKTYYWLRAINFHQFSLNSVHRLTF